MELSSSNIKKIIIFLKIKLFLYFWKWNPALKYIHPEKISYLSGNGNSEKIPYIFSKESCFYISENGEPEKNPYISGKRNPKKIQEVTFQAQKMKKPTLKKILAFQEMELSYISGGNLQSLKIKNFYIFSHKEAKFSKLKYFLIIITWHFFSFYNIFFYTQKAFFFLLLRDFCNVHNHSVAFFFFFFRKILMSFSSFVWSLSLFS